MVERLSPVPSRHAARHGARRAVPFGYESPSCRIGQHQSCGERRAVRCTCLCHSDLYSVIWREGDYVVVTHASGEIELRSGRLIWAEELAKTVGLRPVPGTQLGREEWIREPEVFVRARVVANGIEVTYT